MRLVPHPSGEEIPILLADTDLPLRDPNEFILGRRHLAANTLTRNLRELALLYKWSKENKVDLRQRVREAEPWPEALIRGSLIEFIRLRACRKSAVHPNTFNQRVATIRQHFVWLFNLVLSELSSADSKYEQVLIAKKVLLESLDGCLIGSPPVSRASQKGLSEPQALRLVELLHPDAPRAPGRTLAIKHRNYVIVLIMLCFGLRPGELLSLKVEDIQIGAISSVEVRRRPPDLNDNRSPRPKVKRNGRLIPIVDQSVAKDIDQYITVWRDELESSSESESEYLIVSDEGKPLSQSSVNKLFTNISDKYPDEFPSTFSPKTLRHTFTSQLETCLANAGVEEDRRVSTIARVRGDSSLSSQTTYTEKVIDETARIALGQYHKKLIGVL